MDSTSAYREYTDIASNLNADVKGLKLVFRRATGEGIDSNVKQSVLDAIKLERMVQL